MFAQLDLRVDYNIIYPTWILNIYLDIQNATNRGNQEGGLISLIIKHVNLNRATYFANHQGERVMVRGREKMNYAQAIF